MVTVVLLAEDTRETATTIKTRRSRLAKVLRGALNAKRGKKSNLIRGGTDHMTRNKP